MRTLVISGREVVYEGETQMAVLPGLDGEFSVLDFHQPFLYRLRKGIVKVYETEQEGRVARGKGQGKREGQGSRVKGQEKLFNIKDGLARFSENSLLILCEI